MRTSVNFRMLLVALLIVVTSGAMAQRNRLQYFRAPGQEGLNVFETPKTTDVEFDGLHVQVGGDFALQFQGLSHENSNPGDTLVDLVSNFNLPTANLNLDVQLAEGLRMHLRTYLSSRHHSEAYVKGGYLQIDRLDWISEGLLDEFMDIATIRVGMDEINYGDAHFRRSDNAAAIYNPFVGNYIMDAFTTEPHFELTLQPSSFLIVAGITNGRLNQSPIKGDGGMVFYGKLGYDKQINDEFRFRLTGSLYNSTSGSTRDYIYGGDRAGGRYYNTLESEVSGGSDFDPRFNPGFAYQTAFQINPFIKYGGLEFFGIFEVANNGNNDVGGGFTQLGAEVLYRFGGKEQLYVGGRYNGVNGERTDNADEQKINRVNIGGGWFMTKNVLAKLEYVSQNYDGDGFNGTRYQEGKFNGVMIEAVIGF